MDAWSLPTSTTINGTEYAIRSDFRAVLDMLVVLEDAELTDNERGSLAMQIFYPEFEEMPVSDYEDAAEFLRYFVAGGEQGIQQPSQKLADWEQDFPIIISPVNRVLGFEARAAEYLHWWTFLAAYAEIGDCYFAQVVSIRKKKLEGKKLEKWEREFYRRNRAQIDMKSKVTDADIEFLKELEKGGE
jgi:hypothetical protein